MVLIRILILNMIEILGRSFQPKVHVGKRFRDVRRLTNQRKRHIFPLGRPVEFHDIKKARWKFPPGFSILLSPSRIISNPAYSLSTLHFLSPLI